MANVMRMPTEKSRLKLDGAIQYIADTYGGSAHVFIEKPFLKPHMVFKPCPRCKSPMRVPVLQHGVMETLVGYGIILGCLKAAGLEYTEISSSEWKEHFGLSSDKQLSFNEAATLFPDIKFKHKVQDGMAEAMLISEYGRRILSAKKG
jgi:hypothetical protein